LGSSIRSSLPEYKHVQPSSTTTANAVPPSRLRCSPTDSLEAAADTALARKDVLGTPESPNLATNRRIASDFQASSNDTEQDVVCAFNMYIFGAIIEVLGAIYPDGWMYSFETSESVWNKELEEDEENDTESEIEGDDSIERDDSEERLRYDMTLYIPGNGDALPTVMAIIEFKKVSQIRYSDFRPALVPAESGLHNVYSQQPQGLLLYNARSYTKQVCKYASKRKCPHVALFNWDHLLLFNFHKIKAEPGVHDKARHDTQDGTQYEAQYGAGEPVKHDSEGIFEGGSNHGSDNGSENGSEGGSIHGSKDGSKNGSENGSEDSPESASEDGSEFTPEEDGSYYDSEDGGEDIPEKATAGTEAGLIWVCENDEIEEPFIERMPIRKAMLGWLLNVFQEHGVGTNLIA
jgi:hypothetical protein